MPGGVVNLLTGHHAELAPVLASHMDVNAIDLCGADGDTPDLERLAADNVKRVVHGRGDHAGATPMDLRLDPTLPMAETILELERLANAAGNVTVGTVGEIEVDPGIINAIAARLRVSLDVRGPVDELYRGVARDIAVFAEHAAERRGMRAEFSERQNAPATPMDDRIVGALEAAAQATGEPFMRMHSGAAHDTMCVADRVPTAMVFVPCVDGISHHPAEDADPADAALAAEIILNAVRALT